MNEKSKLKRRRYALRGLFVITTLVCLYFGCWRLTSEFGVEHGLKTRNPGQKINWIYGESTDKTFPLDCRSPMPFVVIRDSLEIGTTLSYPRRYHLWLFGITFQLPYESTWKGEFMNPDFPGTFDPSAKTTERWE